jgi:drug/metabolite transporter (DMT)-like permease
MYLLVILYALLAGTFSLGKVLLSYTQPIFLVGTRMTLAGSILLLYHAFNSTSRVRLQKDHIWFFVQSTLFTIYIPYIFRYWGLVYLSSSKACLLYNFGPFISYTLSYLLCGEKITLKKCLGLVIGFCGLLPIIGKSSQATLAHVPFLLPECALLISVSSMSYGWLIIHRMINQHGYAPSFVNGISMFFGGLLAFLTALVIEPSEAFITDLVPFLCLLSIIVIISNLICHNLYGYLLKRFTPTMMSFAGSMSPLFAALYGWLFMAEQLTFDFFMALITVFIGLSLFYHDELRQTDKVKNTPATL